MGQVETANSKVPYQPELQAQFLVLRAEAETLYCRLKTIQDQQRLDQSQGDRPSLATSALDRSSDLGSLMPQLAGASA
jgi:hypothetical protein